MKGWWDEIDDQILNLLVANGEMDLKDLAEKLRMSEAAVCSCLALLASQGQVRIRRAAATESSRPRRVAA